MCLLGGEPQSPEGEVIDQRRRKVVVCQAQQSVGSQSKEMSCASALPGTA